MYADEGDGSGLDESLEDTFFCKDAEMGSGRWIRVLFVCHARGSGVVLVEEYVGTFFRNF